MHAMLVATTGGGASEGGSETSESEEGGQEQEKKGVEEEEGEQEKTEEKQEEKSDSEEEKKDEEEDGELQVPGNGNYLHWMLPSGLEKLSIQGPVSMIPQLDALANAFESAEFLPNLKSISLVLDLPESKDTLENDTEDGTEERDEKKEEEKRIKREEEKEKQFAEQLAEAHAACKKVLDVAVAKRGAVVEGYEQPWSELFPALFKRVDRRWLELDGEKKE
ncbi:hypothetical protein B0J18DRAFT_426843 [Chaetomium sp. MPI-SDFR-AT-0129]|nr:hypothetical protein B0J18DRAFT_426843 [Chaetomium sp. MPI-SDFR-AT-0129]